MKAFSKSNLLNILIILSCMCLVLLWIVLSVFLINTVSFSVITFITQNENKYSNDTFYLRRDAAYHGTFQSKDNNLGLIITQLKRREFKKSTPTNIVFKLKDAASAKYIFQKSYDIGLFDSQTSFSFGFPIISDSARKEYSFDLYLKNANKETYVEIKNPESFITGYKYEKSQIFSDKSLLAHFIINKTIGSFSDNNFVIKSLVFLFPLVVFLIFAFSVRSILHANRKLSLSKSFKYSSKYLKYIILFLVFAEFSFPQILQLPSSYVLIILWFVGLFIIKFKSKISFITCLLLIVLWIVIIPFNLKELESNLNVLVYFSFATGVVQLLIEQGKQK